MTHHYFASCAIGWACGETAEDAIKKLAKANISIFKGAIKNAQRDGEPGLYIWTCKVDLPLDEPNYRIEFYSPKTITSGERKGEDVPKSEPRNNYITHLTAKDCYIYTAPSEA